MDKISPDWSDAMAYASDGRVSHGIFEISNGNPDSQRPLNDRAERLDQYRDTVNRLEAENAALRAELVGLTKDAARWRFFSANAKQMQFDNRGSKRVRYVYHNRFSSYEYDWHDTPEKAIDSAMPAPPKEGE